MSGGIPLDGIVWKPYNASPSPPPPPPPPPGQTWFTLAGYNSVYDAKEGPKFHFFGKTMNASACQDACAAAKCTIYTWHDPHCAGYANDVSLWMLWRCLRARAACGGHVQ